LNRVLKPLPLALRILDRQSGGIGHAKRLKGCKGANHSRLARDMRLVDGGRKLVRIGESAQRFTPGLFVRRRPGAAAGGTDTDSDTYAIGNFRSCRANIFQQI
jgi:hypothetical protein